MDTVNAKKIGMIVAMGFTRTQAGRALEATGGNVDDALEYLLSRRLESDNLYSHTTVGMARSSRGSNRRVDTQHQTHSLGMMAISNTVSRSTSQVQAGMSTPSLKSDAIRGTGKCKTVMDCSLVSSIYSCSACLGRINNCRNVRSICRGQHQQYYTSTHCIPSNTTAYASWCSRCTWV